MPPTRPDFLSLGGGKGSEVQVFYRLTIPNRYDSQAKRGRLDDESRFGSLLHEAFHRSFPPSAQVPKDFIVLLVILLTGIGPLDAPADIFDQQLHVLLELAPFASWEAQRFRLVGVVEVVDVNPVPRPLLPLGPLLKKGPHLRHLADARRAGDVNVKARVLNTQPRL